MGRSSGEVEDNREVCGLLALEWRTEDTTKSLSITGLTVDPVKLVPPPAFLTDVTLKDLSES